MVKWIEQADLDQLHGFQTPAQAKYLVQMENEADIQAIFQDIQAKDLPYCYLGGGFNTLFASDYPGIVLQNCLQGRNILSHNESQILLEVNSGENWDNLMEWCIDQDMFGLENLSGIPGSVGGAVTQNIGAYGVHLQSFVRQVTVWLPNEKKFLALDHSDCGFAYRTSLFQKNNWFIVSVLLSLNQVFEPQMEYAGLRDLVANRYQEKINEKINAKPPGQTMQKSLANLWRNLIMQIRNEKLPDPQVLGNCGSFFKNPVIDADVLRQWQTLYPVLPFFELSPNRFKIPAAWLIEQTGWKGKTWGQAGVYANHALVLVNHGNAQGYEVFALATEIQQSVQNKFGVVLEPEVLIR